MNWEFLLKSIDSINYHITVLNGEMGGVEKALIQVQTDVEWLKKFFWLVAAGVIAQLILQLFTLRNGRNKK